MVLPLAKLSPGNGKPLIWGGLTMVLLLSTKLYRKWKASALKETDENPSTEKILSMKHEASTVKKVDNTMTMCQPDLLPDDLWGLIIHHLHLVDRFHLGLTSKRFLTIVCNAPRQDCLLFGSPCLLLFENGCRKCRLVNPMFNEEYFLNTPTLPSVVKVLFARDGWLLLLSREDEKSIFFFNPLTQVRINLPDVYFSTLSAFNFTSTPTLPDCVVVAVNVGSGWARVYTCSRGDGRWSMNEFYGEELAFDVRCTNLVFHKGSLYCLGFFTGTLAIFDIAKKTLEVCEKPGPNKSNCDRIHLVESDGEVLCVRANKFGDSIDVHKLDPMTKQWEVTCNTGERNLYVGHIVSISSACTSAEKSERIYFQMLRDGEIVFCSIATGELHKVRNFRDSVSEYATACWIEAKWNKPSLEELWWCRVEPSSEEL